MGLGYGNGGEHGEQLPSHFMVRGVRNGLGYDFTVWWLNGKIPLQRCAIPHLPNYLRLGGRTPCMGLWAKNKTKKRTAEFCDVHACSFALLRSCILIF